MNFSSLQSVSIFTLCSNIPVNEVLYSTPDIPKCLNTGFFKKTFKSLSAALLEARIFSGSDMERI